MASSDCRGPLQGPGPCLGQIARPPWARHADHTARKTHTSHRPAGQELRGHYERIGRLKDRATTKRDGDRASMLHCPLVTKDAGQPFTSKPPRVHRRRHKDMLTRSPGPHPASQRAADPNGRPLPHLNTDCTERKNGATTTPRRLHDDPTTTHYDLLICVWRTLPYCY
jgi:hypothetical protein